MSKLVTKFWDVMHSNLVNDKREGFKAFLTWKTIKQTMFVNNPVWAAKELNYLLETNFNRYEDKITESVVGMPPNNYNLIHMLYHLALFENKSKVLIENIDTIFEAGAGYGCMCKSVHSLGFQGNYTIYDLPAFVKMQEWYLNNFKITPRLLSSKDQLKLQTVEANGKSLFISTWALSEMPLDLRYEILEQTKGFNYFLLAYQHEIEDIDNIKFFYNLRQTRNDLKWVCWEIQHIPKNYYLIGYPK